MDDKKIIRITLENALKLEGKTNWARLVWEEKYSKEKTRPPEPAFGNKSPK